MHLLDRLHMRHRFLRYRYRTEAESIRYLLGHVARGSTALDVGTNRGIYSYYLSRAVGPDGLVIGFDPQAEAIEAVRSMCDGFGCRNVRLEHAALGATSGTIRLARREVLDGGAQVLAGDVEAGDREVVTVRSLALDDYCRDHEVPRVGFIKIDVEGHELAVLEGATELLARDRPALVIEIWHGHAAEGSVFRLLDAAGYDGFFLVGHRRIPVAEFADHPYRKKTDEHRNYIFEPRGG